jgi:SAM-dependent methyltransferase
MALAQNGSPTDPPSAACLVCGASRWDERWKILLRCRGCGFLTAWGDAAADVSPIYQGDYFTGGEYLDYAADERLFRRNFQQRLAHLRRFKQDGLLLEIGAAYGFFLALAGPHFETVGFELNPSAAEHARTVLGLDVRTDDFLAATMADIGGHVDAAVLWDVIEHLPRPDRFLSRIAALSKPEAVLCLTTGDVGSPLARLRGRRWRMIHPPTHLHYFSRSTIDRLLRGAGYRVVEIRTIGVARSYRQILYSLLVNRLGRQRAESLAARWAPEGRGITLNTGDIMQVTAIKQ